MSQERLLAELARLGVEDTLPNFRKKLSRGRFTAVFLLQVMAAIGVDWIKLPGPPGTEEGDEAAAEHGAQRLARGGVRPPSGVTSGGWSGPSRPGLRDVRGIAPPRPRFSETFTRSSPPRVSVPVGFHSARAPSSCRLSPDQPSLPAAASVNS